MRTIDADLLKRMQLPQGTGHWTWCYEIIVDEDVRGVLPLLNLDAKAAGRGGN